MRGVRRDELQILAERAHRVDDVAGPIDERVPCRRRLYFVGAAVEEAVPDLGLQLLQAPAERGLGDFVLLGGEHETAVSVQGDEVLELADFHRDLRFLRGVPIAAEAGGDGAIIWL